ATLQRLSAREREYLARGARRSGERFGLGADQARTHPRHRRNGRGGDGRWRGHWTSASARGRRRAAGYAYRRGQARRAKREHVGFGTGRQVHERDALARRGRRRAASTGPSSDERTPSVGPGARRDAGKTRRTSEG